MLVIDTLLVETFYRILNKKLMLQCIKLPVLIKTLARKERSKFDSLLIKVL
jgi:hypothetical protein